MDGAKPDVEDVVDATDPLAGLLEKTTADPGAPFAPEILAALADLKKADRAAFETLRAGLKRTGCRVTALDDALAEESGGGGATNARSQTQADILLRLAQGADLFHTPDLTCYADLDIKATAKHGSYAREVSTAGWRGLSSTRPMGRPVRKPWRRLST